MANRVVNKNSSSFGILGRGKGKGERRKGKGEKRNGKGEKERRNGKRKGEDSITASMKT
jgi:hypothetical protein